MYFVYIKDSGQHGRLLSWMYHMAILGTICFLMLHVHAIAKDSPDLANVHIVTHSSILVLLCAVSLFKITTCTKNEVI